MKTNGINNWIELKKNTHNFETIVNSRKILKKGTPWNDMDNFFKAADKLIK